MSLKFFGYRLLRIVMTLCPMGVTGYFQHPFDWTKYLDCTNGDTLVKLCPSGSVFSISRGVCEFDAQVSLDDRCSHGRNKDTEIYGAEHSQNVIAADSVETGAAKCPAGASGMYPHPYDCAKFLNCVNGMTYVQSCGPGTVWNAASKVCDFPHKVECSQRSGQLRESKSLNSVAKGPIVECPKGFVGLYPHPFDCTRFLNCDQGTTHVQACGPGTAWNIAMEVCDFITNVDCSPQSRIYNTAKNRGAKTYDNSATSTGSYVGNGGGSWSQTATQQHYGGAGSTSSQTFVDHGHGHGSANNYDSSTATAGSYNGFGSNAGVGSTSTTTTYTDRWSNMHMARPDAKAYGQAAGGSTTWTPGSYGQNQYGQQLAGSTWSAAGSSIDHKTPTENTIYMEGSLEPNRNYAHTLNIYNAPTAPLAPLAPFSPNVANGGTTTTTGSTHVVYAQPVDSEENSYEHVRNGDRTTTSLSASNRQNHSRHINHLSTANGWTPIVQHEGTLETHVAQQPNTQLLPPTNRQIYHAPHAPHTPHSPNTHLMPPYQNPQAADYDSQRPLDLQDHIQSGSALSPVVSTVPSDASNLYGGLQPPTLYKPTPPSSPSSSVSWSQPTIRPDESNLYGGLQPPHTPTTAESAHDFNISRTLQAPPAPTQPSNLHIYPIYPLTPNVTSHGNPHYSSPYAGVAHSRNTTWITPRLGADAVDSESKSPNPQIPDHSLPQLTTTTTTTERRFASMPPPYNRQYYQGSTATQDAQPTTPLITDTSDSDLPLSDALRMLLRPYFNHSGSANEETAHEAESHIMRLVKDSQQTTTTPKPKVATRFATPTIVPSSIEADNTQQWQQSEEDVELILAGEQHSLVALTTKNGTREVRTQFRTNQQNFNDTKTYTENWHTDRDHSREFHLRHPNLPNPYPADAKQTDTYDAKYGHHTHHHHHHHNRDFHLRHPELPSPFTTSTTATTTGGRSIHSTDSFNIPNPYAESTTPALAFHSRSSVLDTKHDCQFDCGNGKCAQRFEVCNGVDDCGNRRDESQCDHLGYQVRLTGGEKDNMGRIEVKVLGKWGYVCDDKFGLLDADVVCRELGFTMGASEVRGNSFYPPLEVNFAFAMDEVECRGNETSLKDCKFKGWGVHNCSPDEVAGVVCKIPLFKCPNNYWLCSTSKECIPRDFVCDRTPDCDDKSDESEQVCNSPIEYRLEGGRNKNEGRLEVKYRGEWGTVCDDDFGLREAQVACNSLGYYGKATVEKNIYGPGRGPIWLDQVACLGNETSIDKCNHWNWGEQNCNHTEDISIRCTAGPPPQHLVNSNRRYDDDVQQQQTELDDVMDLYQSTLERSSGFLRAQPNCGHFKPNLIDEYAHPEQRVVNGTIAKRGRHPWQATIRTRGRGGISSHWCGAVLIGDGNAQHSSYLLTAAHCLAGYQKGAYFVRMGDHYANIAESSEIDAYIENWYVHEKFRDQADMNNDIALLVLKTPVRFNDYIQPICLPEKGQPLQTGRECTISGWGSIKSGISTPSNFLRAAKVPILADETCKQPQVYGASITEGMFCAGFMDESIDACDGDSGGPFVCSDNGTDILYGIISWGQHCGYANKPGVYVRIEKYIDWIYEKINFSLQQNGALN